MTLFSIAECRLAVCNFLLRRGEILFDGLSASRLARDRGLELRRGRRHRGSMTLFGSAACRFAVCNFLLRGREILHDSTPAGRLQRDRGLEVRLAMRSLPFGGETFGCNALFGDASSGVGVSQLYFERL